MTEPIALTGLALRFSVAICAFTEDRWDDLVRSVHSARDQTLAPFETIVVIDHNDRLLARATDAFPWARVLTNEGARGLSDGRNTGVRASAGSVVAFLDDDAAADADWLATMADAYRDANVIGVGGSAIPEWDSGRPAWFPEEFDWVVGCSYTGMPTKRAPVRNPLGCNMSFRSEAFVAAGPFATTVGRVGSRPIGGEETEFCIRLQRAMPGHVILYEPAARVRHRVRASRGTWSYFASRCYGEGLSKAVVSGLVRSSAGLATERRYTSVTLPLGVARNLTQIPRRPVAALRAGAIVAGLGITTAGYLLGRVRSGPRRRRGAARASDAP